MPTTQNEQKRGSRAPHLATVALSVFAATVFGFMAGFVAGQPTFAETLSRYVPQLSSIGTESALAEVIASSPVQPPPTEEDRRIAVVERSLPAVVSVVVSKDMPVLEQYYYNPFGGRSDFFGGMFDLPEFRIPQYRQNGTEKREIGAGTGFVVSADGLIVTNKHVVADEEAEYTVVTSDGESHEAQVLGRDPVNDIAVLKIEGSDMAFIEFAEDEVRVGQSVIAIGYALGQFSNTVSAGIVSGLSRDITAGDGSGNVEALYDVIQTDAAINPGNSGGPLLDLQGRALGVNVAVERGAQGIGFAIPAGDVASVVRSVAETGRISRPFLGVRYLMINGDIAEANQLPVDYGALVVRGETQTDLAVTPGSPADIAGIVENDIILEIDGERLDEDNPLFLAVRGKMAGDTIRLKVLHKGEEIEYEVTLVERQ